MEANDESENGSEDESQDEVDDNSSMTFADQEEEKLEGSIDVDRANVGKFSKVHFPTTCRTLHMFLCRLEAHPHLCGCVSSPFLCYHS